MYNVLILLVYLTEPLKENLIQDFKYKEDYCRCYESYKELFVNEDFIGLLMSELGDSVKTLPENRSSF